jgi:hypothetical protein
MVNFMGGGGEVGEVRYLPHSLAFLEKSTFEKEENRPNINMRN